MANDTSPGPSSASSQPEPEHTFGPGCRLAAVPQPALGDWLEDIPPIKAQFLYTSLIPIDDPFSATSEAKPPKQPLRPFSEEDNNSLEAAWLKLSTESDRENHKAARLNRTPNNDVAKTNDEALGLIIRNLSARHRLKHAYDEAAALDAAMTARTIVQGPAASIPPCCDALYTDASTELSKIFCPLVMARQTVANIDKVVQQTMVAMGKAKAKAATTVARSRNGSQSVASSDTSRPGVSLAQQFNNNEPPRGEHIISSLENAAPAPQNAAQDVSIPSQDQPATGVAAIPLPIRAAAGDDGISGKPFIRAATPNSSIPSAMPMASLPRVGKTASTSLISTSLANSYRDMSQPQSSTVPPSPANLSDSHHPPLDAVEEQTLQTEIRDTAMILSKLATTAKIPVGISRLHTVDLPTLQMKPIYWSPINDISIVQRSTWFYHDTMLPVDATVANQLELHYRELRPWSETWAIELKCAIDIGAAAEEKVSQALWPVSYRRSTNGKPDSLASEPELSSDSFCAAHCHQGAAAANGTLLPRTSVLPESIQEGGAPAATAAVTAASKMFANYHVVYKNATTAFLLKPSLRSSAYYNRRPVSKIMKGATIGIPVVRGFDREAWNRIQEKAPGKPSGMPRPTSTEGQASQSPGSGACLGCEAKMKKHRVSDLVLVVHGVGQKLAQRVESFHFTHAVNGLRRAMNLELKKPVVQTRLRDGQNGVMVLPINWRHTLSFEEGGFAGTPGQAADGFGLKDIEPNTIPAVRSMISDVMFDIPFYMSHHKPKMIQSLITEANRVYRLWCQNNPGFAEHGRVHLIGHSLGSAMSVEVLSRQPTVLPPLDLSAMPASSQHFEFDTKNLFLLGSPSAFFLLLERGALMPRRGRQKAGVDPQDSEDVRVAGEAGTFGCLAVDNIYNILAKEDPIAYLLNGTIDTSYAASLKTAYVPSASPGFFASLGNSFRGAVSGTAPAVPPVDPTLDESSSLPPITRLPSQLELEVHDFTREEIAERKAYLLNDNGQVDYYLQSGGGPLEIQYLNMLSAHTSYWSNPDLIRMLCIEIGRRPGKSHTLPAMRAAKSAKRIVPGMIQS